MPTEASKTSKGESRNLDTHGCPVIGVRADGLSCDIFVNPRIVMSLTRLGYKALLFNLGSALLVLLPVWFECSPMAAIC